MNAKPLEGITVVERGGRLCAAVAATLLANCGATVIRLEESAGRPQSDPSSWHLHPIAREGKQIVQPDPDPQARAAQWDALVRSADVVIQSVDVTPPHRADSPLTAVFTGLGRDEPASPYGATVADEWRLQALCGVMAVSGHPGQAPQITATPMLELWAGINGATSIAAALRTAAASRGVVLDLAIYDTAMSLLGTFHNTAILTPARVFREGCRHPLIAPWNSYPTADGRIVVCTTTNEHWKRVVDLMGMPALADDPRFALMPDRVAHVDEIDVLISNWMSGKTTAEALDLLAGIAIPAGEIATIPDMIASQRKQGHIRETANDGGAPLVCPAPIIDIDFESASGTPAPKAATPTGNGKPLDGIRVVEIGPYTAGPFTGRLLAALGAEVIKVEPPEGEVSRKWAPDFGGFSGYYHNYNAGKKCMRLDLRDAAQTERLWSLLEGAQVLIQNLSPGALARAGFGYESVRARAPGIVYCSISGFGASASPRPAVDTIIQAASGLMALVGNDRGTRDQMLLKSGISVGDLIAANLSALSIIAALAQRDRNGQGCHIDVSMQSALAWMTQLEWNTAPDDRMDAAMLSCADGFVYAPAVDRARQFETSPQTTSKTRAQVVAELAEAGIEATPVLEPREVISVHRMERRMLLQWPPFGDSWVPILSSPHRWSSRTPISTACVDLDAA